MSILHTSSHSFHSSPAGWFKRGDSASKGAVLLATIATSCLTLAGCGGLSVDANSTPSTPSTLSCASKTIAGTATDICTIALNGIAKDSTTISLSSNSPAVVVPSTVTVAALSTSAGFTATVSAVSASQTATLTATSGTTSATFELQLLPVSSSGGGMLSVSAASVSFGGVALNSTATQAVTLSSTGTAAVTVTSATVTGTGFAVSGASFPLTLNPGQTVTLNLQFSAQQAGAAAGALTIASDSPQGNVVVSLGGTGVAATALNGISCSQTSMSGAGTDACTANLTATAPAGGVSIQLASNNAAVTVPASVTVPAGSTGAGFTATVAAVSALQTATLTATSGTASATLALQLLPVLPAGSGVLSVGATSIAFGGLALNAAATQAVTLSSTGTVAVTVTSATVAGTGFTVSGASFPLVLTPGQTATLNVQFKPVTAGAATGQLTVASNSAQGSLVVSMSGTGTAVPTLNAISCSQASMSSAGTDACTATLTSAAPTGGMSIQLASNKTTVTVPASVTVPAGSTSVGFSATVTAVSSSQTVTLTATSGSASATFALQLLPAGSGTLSVNATSISFGGVVINSIATQSITLSSTGTSAAIVTSATVTGAGFTVSGASFPLTLNPSQTATLNVQFKPTTSGAKSGQLTIASTALSSGSAVVSLSGTGQPHQVDLTWSAPNSSSDPVAGYRIYRAASGSSSYQLLNSSINTQTSFIDSACNGATAYQYYVTSVDASGAESVPSNTASVTIP